MPVCSPLNVCIACAFIRRHTLSLPCVLAITFIPASTPTSSRRLRSFVLLLVPFVWRRQATIASARQLSLAHAHAGAVDLMTGKAAEAAERFERQLEGARKARRAKSRKTKRLQQFFGGRFHPKRISQEAHGRPQRNLRPLLYGFGKKKRQIYNI